MIVLSMIKQPKTAKFFDLIYILDCIDLLSANFLQLWLMHCNHAHKA